MPKFESVLGHLYTATNASMLTEFAVRCVSNIKVYSAVLWRALYFPDYFNRTGTLIPLDDPIIVLTKNIFPYIEYNLSAVQSDVLYWVFGVQKSRCMQ